MIRRLKKDVLSQLPPKRRQRIMLSMPAKQAAQFKAQIEQLQELEKVPLFPVRGVVAARLGPVMLTCLWCAFCCNHNVAMTRLRRMAMPSTMSAWRPPPENAI